ncbi:MAG: NAAT family transporter [Sphingomonadales bacterium]|nr:NAAT family transporter [Sphingomonadales bacterium]
MIELFLSAFFTLFVVIDPVGCAPIFAGLVRGMPARETTATALRATLIATLILVTFALVGERLLAALQIGLDAFRIAGGLMLFLIALEMVFEKRTEHDQERAERAKSAPPAEDLAVFPMAMPMIAGPGSIASVMLLTAQAQGLQQTVAVMAALLAVLALVAIALAAAGPLMRLLGTRVEGVITRLLGVLLSALAVQYVIDGVRGVLALR